MVTGRGGSPRGERDERAQLVYALFLVSEIYALLYVSEFLKSFFLPGDAADFSAASPTKFLQADLPSFAQSGFLWRLFFRDLLHSKHTHSHLILFLKKENFIEFSFRFFFLLVVCDDDFDSHRQKILHNLQGTRSLLFFSPKTRTDRKLRSPRPVPD